MPPAPPRLIPSVDLQGGLQYLSSLLRSAGQLLGAEEVAGSAHLQHCDHGRVSVQSRSQLGPHGEQMLDGGPEQNQKLSDDI